MNQEDSFASYFLSKDERSFFEALCETIVPEGEDPKAEPGANTVGAVSYIDSFLYSLPVDAAQYFRRAIESLNMECEKKFGKKFAELDTEQRDGILREFYLNSKTREQMFDLRSLALEGFYSDYHDPAYGGMTAWQYVGFGGKRISDLEKDWSFLRVWKDWKVEERKGETSLGK